MRQLGTLAAVLVSTLVIAQPAAGPALPLEKLAAGFEAHPPHLGDNSDRVPYYEALDGWVNRPDAVYWDLNPDTRNPELLRYYLDRIDRALKEAADLKVTSGATVWKLYSSGFLVKTPQATFAFDAVEGPFKNVRKSPEEQPGFVFHWTPDMRRRFAALVDVSFISHHHYDHTSFALMRELALAGKTVVVPPDLKKTWKDEPFAPQLRTVASGVDEKVGRLTVRAFGAVQAMKKDDAGNWIPRPGDPNHNVYLVRAPGAPVFMHNGDNRGIEFTPWLQKAVDDGWKPRVWFKIMGWPTNVVEQVETIVMPVIVPGHEYEMGHKPKYGVNSLMNFYRGLGRERFPQNRMLILSWGEKFSFKD